MLDGLQVPAGEHYIGQAQGFSILIAGMIIACIIPDRIVENKMTDGKLV